MKIMLNTIAGIIILVPVFCPAAEYSYLDITYHELVLNLDPSAHLMQAGDRISLSVKKRGSYVFVIGRDFNISRIELNGRKIRAKEIESPSLFEQFGDDFEDFPGDVKGLEIRFNTIGDNVLDISYEGIVNDTLKVPEYSRGSVAEETSGIISSDGTYLSGSTRWYPDIPGDYSFFSLKVSMPPGFFALTEGKKTSPSQEPGESAWEIFYPSKDITLVAGRYEIVTEEMDGITVMACFFPSERDLIQQYMEASKKYLQMYNSLIGPYPFSKFAIVENFFPTGFGMPSYTLLGRRVIRLPFIVYTSLGHEVAHNWWGNSVYPDYSSGNWCEGLTVYFADHRYKKMRSDSAAADYRRTLDIDYSTYVNGDNDFSLTQFKERTTPATRAVGYGKCAMVFHMLKMITGEETFYRALRNFYQQYQFKEASWKDIEKVIEKTSGKNLDLFFEQWVKNKGAPTIKLAGVHLDSSSGSYLVNVHIKQDPAYNVYVPIEIAGGDTSFVEYVWLAGPDSFFAFNCSFKPGRVSVDPRYDLFRRMEPGEIPPTISSVLGDQRSLLVLPSRAEPDAGSSYDSLIKQLNRTGEGIIKADTSVTIADLKQKSLLVLGGKTENAIFDIIPLPAAVELNKDGFAVAGSHYNNPGHSAYITFKNPYNPSKSVCVITGMTADAVAKSGYKIIHYGKYSFVTFENGKRISAGILPVEDNPLVYAID